MSCLSIQLSNHFTHSRKTIHKSIVISNTRLRAAYDLHIMNESENLCCEEEKNTQPEVHIALSSFSSWWYERTCFNQVLKLFPCIGSYSALKLNFLCWDMRVLGMIYRPMTLTPKKDKIIVMNHNSWKLYILSSGATLERIEYNQKYHQQSCRSLSAVCLMCIKTL